jgi:hypothetical protein
MEVLKFVKVFQSSVFTYHTSYTNTLNKQIVNNLLYFKKCTGKLWQNCSCAYLSTMPKTNSTVNNVTVCFIDLHTRRTRRVVAYMLYTCTTGSQQFSPLEKCTVFITVFKNTYNGKGIQKKKGKR